MPTICHVTTAHRVNDVRIYERECRSLATLPDTRVILLGWGSLPAGATVTHVELPPPPSSRPRRFAVAPVRAWRSVAKLNADVFHFHDPELIPVALRLAHQGRRVIWDAHEDYEEQFRTGAGKEWLPGPARSAASRFAGDLLRRTDRAVAGVVAATPTIASRYSNGRTVVVGNEARIGDFASARPRLESGRVLFTGQTSDAHCFTELVRAVASTEALTLAVAGREPDPESWGHAAGLLGSRLEHLGWLDRQGLVAAMSDSAVAVVSYADRPTNRSNSPNKVFESAAAGLPVVCTPNDGLKALVGRGGFGVIADNFSADALARALESATRDYADWDLMSKRAREFAAVHGSWEASEQRLFGLYGEILGMGFG